MEEYPMARMYRDVRVGTIGGGSSEIMREIIAKIVIDGQGYKKASSKNENKNANKKTNGSAKTVASNSQTNKVLMVADILPSIQTQAAKASPLGKTLKFDFGGEQLFIDGTGAENMVSATNGEADCSVKLSLEDFIALTKGELNPMGAVMSGKVRIDGDMMVAMKLQELFA